MSGEQQDEGLIEQQMDDSQKNETLAERFERAIRESSSEPAHAIILFETLQVQVAQLSLFSDNEELADISTKSLPFLSLEHHLAMCHMSLPMQHANMTERYTNLQRACDYWTAFLQRLDQLELLTKEERTQYHDLMELSQQQVSSHDHQDVASSRVMPPPMNRDVKIHRFRQKQVALQERERLVSLQQRRNRLNISETDDLDGYDYESLLRNLYLKALEIDKLDALEEWSSVIRELPMICMMLQRQTQQGEAGNGTTAPSTDVRAPPAAAAFSNNHSNKPLQVTRITQDAATGRLQMRQEEIRSQVFQPGWTQPTMSLEALAEREVSDALERQAQQTIAEANRKLQPRRFDLLRKDGLEDDANLVDASALLDRQWDDWKEENPRGSGNKRANVGDRNF
ncbi:hypothetical protein MPSEU_000765900 [Mayamaea pseudoterrestris]|nr:hypothetical protein MPSEU_000765900 [Mayamaea pseudoterrestris]